MEEYEHNLLRLLEDVQRGRNAMKWLNKNKSLHRFLCKYVLRVNRECEDGELPGRWVVLSRMRDAVRLLRIFGDEILKPEEHKNMCRDLLEVIEDNFLMDSYSIRSELQLDSGKQAHVCQSELAVWKEKKGVVEQGRNADESNKDGGEKEKNFGSQSGSGKSEKSVHNGSSSHHHHGNNSLTMMKHENINEGGGGHSSGGRGNTLSLPHSSVKMGSEQQRRRTHHEMMDETTSSGDNDMPVHSSPKQQQLQQKAEEEGVGSSNLNEQSQHQQPDAEVSKYNNNNDSQRMMMNDTTKSPTFSIPSQDANMFCTEVTHQEKEAQQSLPQMQHVGLFSKFDGVEFVSYDGNLIDSDSRLQHGHRMVLQEMKRKFEHRVHLSNEERYSMKLKLRGCELIKVVAETMKQSLLYILSSLLFFHKYQYYCKEHEIPIELETLPAICMACLLLGGKSSDAETKLSHLSMRISHYRAWRDVNVPLPDAQQIIQFESRILESCAYDTHVDHPVHDLENVCCMLNATNDVRKWARHFFRTRQYQFSELCMCSDPRAVAVVAVLWAVESHNAQTGPDGVWWSAPSDLFSRLNGPSLEDQHYESTPISEDMINLFQEELVASVCRTNALLEA